MPEIKIKQNGKGDKTWVIALIVLAVVGLGWTNRYNDFDDYREPPNTVDIQHILQHSAKVLAKSPKSTAPAPEPELPTGIAPLNQTIPLPTAHRE